MLPENNIQTNEERELMIDILSQELARVFQEIITGSSTGALHSGTAKEMR